MNDTITDGVSALVLANGIMLLVEPMTNPNLDRRAFRSVGNSYEWAHLSDVQANDVRARFYGWASKELPASMICKARNIKPWNF